MEGIAINDKLTACDISDYNKKPNVLFDHRCHFAEGSNRHVIAENKTKPTFKVTKEKKYDTIFFPSSPFGRLLSKNM